jgi:predicted alpha/beta hydrolase
LGDGAKCPLEGEDVDGVVSWVEERRAGEGRKVYFLGHSEGGMHVATWLFGENFAARTAAFLRGNGFKLDGAVFLCTPFPTDRMDVA